MEKKTSVIFAIAFVIVCILVVTAAMVLMLVLVPQVNSTGTQAGEYKGIAKQDYIFSGAEIEQLKKQYGVTESDVNKGLDTKKYYEGNINPFTPKADVTIYNEPTLKNENSSGPLTPDSK